MLKASQKSWLAAAKRALSKRHPGLTWDDFARIAGIEPRAFKTYRMPQNSDNYRTMPPLARQVIERLLDGGTEEIDAAERKDSIHTSAGLLIPALAALVVRQARLSLIEGNMVAGVTRTPGSPVGLEPEDRRAMAMVSRACLANGFPDQGAEIHNLLAACTRPLGEWLPVPEVAEAGLNFATMIHEDEGIPTAEAEELAVGFGGMTAGLEEQLFAKFMEILGRFPEDSANTYYTQVREFVVRHPVCTADDLKTLGNNLPSLIWIVLQQQFYEAVPMAWEAGSGVPICDYCGNAMRLGSAGLVCRTATCAVAAPAKTSAAYPAAGLLRVSRGIRQYWVEPGIDEIRLYDALRHAGMEPQLYPFRDRVDIAVGETGIDLKTYASPETLGLRLKRGIGGLAYYAKRMVVVPDWQVASMPSYLDRLRRTMGRDDIVCLTVSEALARISRTKAGHA